MRTIAMWATNLMLLVGPVGALASPTTVELVTTDGKTLIADFRSTSDSSPIVLLFHQAAGNAQGELAPIADDLQSLFQVRSLCGNVADAGQQRACGSAGGRLSSLLV